MEDRILPRLGFTRASNVTTITALASRYRNYHLGRGQNMTSAVGIREAKVHYDPCAGPSF